MKYLLVVISVFCTAMSPLQSKVSQGTVYGYGSEMFRIDAARAALQDAKTKDQALEKRCEEAGDSYRSDFGPVVCDTSNGDWYECKVRVSWNCR